MTYIKTTTNPIWTEIKPITSEEYAEMENEMVKKTEEIQQSANDHQVAGSHYRQGKIQPWDAMQDWMSEEGFRSFLLGNALKYIARAGKKGEYKEDIQKAHHYLEKLLEIL
jgi:hypothetical protein